MMVGSRVLGSHLRPGSSEPRMDDSNDMEEGEACYYKERDGDIDPDITLSYIDEKIQRFLGHFQKDFEGAVSVENLGAKFGTYGSFLPTYERLPSIWPHKINRQRDCNATRSLDNVALQGSSQNPKAPEPVRREATLCNAISSRNTRETSGSISGRVDSCLPSTEVTNNYPSKDGTLSSSGNLMNNRSLKVRIKVGSDNTALKNAAIYSGLGLDDSPMSSSDNSTDVSEGMLPISQSPMDESPTKIIQAMTSFPVPHGALISPLHDSLLWLSRKEKPFRETKDMLSLEDQNDSLPKLVDETSLMQNESKLVKEKKKRVWHRERQVNLKDEVFTCLGKEKTTLINGKSENEAFEGKAFIPNKLQCKPVSDSHHDFHNLKPSCSASDVSLRKKEDRLKGRFKESYVETISRQDCLKSSKQRSKDEKVLEQKEENSGNYVLAPNLGDNREYKTVKTYASLEDPSDGTKCNAYLDPQKKKLSRKAMSHESDKDKLSIKKEKPGIVGKNKLKVLQDVGGRTAGSFDEGFNLGSGAPKGRKDTNSDTPECESKKHTVKLHNKKVGVNKSNSFNSSGLDQNCNSKDVIERAPGDLRKVKDLDDSGTEKFKFRNETKERWKSNKIDAHFMSGASVRDGQGASPLVIGNDRGSKVAEPAVVAPLVIEENWVCCDSCQKWRLLPFGTKPEQLPEKWLCSMLNWLPGMNRCDISEQETTEKLNALYQLPLSESGDVLHNHANGPTSGSTSNQGKKKEGSKEIQNPGSSIGQSHVHSSLKNQQQESRKSRSLNGLSNPPNQLRNSMDQSYSELHNLVEGKKLKEKFVDRAVNCEQLKRKNKRPEENGLHFEAVRYSKTGDMCFVDNNQDFNVDLGKLGSSTNSGLSNVEGGEGVLKHGDIGLTKHDKLMTEDKMQVPLKKQGKQAEISSDVRSSVNQACGKNDSCTKKRKLKDWQDDQNCHNSALHESIPVKEEICERFKKKKKAHVSKMEGHDTSKSNGDYNPKREGRTTQFSISGIGNDFTNGMEEIINCGKDKELQLQKKKNISKQTPVGKELLKRNLGPRQVSVATNSSSSKVSLSHVTKVKIGKVKASPAESVSSSPMRTSSLDQFGGEKEEITSNIHSDSHKVSPMFGFGVKDTVLNSSRKKTRPAPDVQHHLVSADASIVKQPRLCNNHIDDSMEPSYKKLKKVFPDKEISPENKDLFLISNEKEKSVLSDMELDKAKAFDGTSERSKKSMIYEPEVDSYHVALCPNRVGDIEQNIPRKSGTKLTRKEKIHVGGEGLETPQNLKDHDAEDQRSGALSQSSRTVRLQNKQSWDFEAVSKGGQNPVETRDGKSKCSLSSGGECKKETLRGADPLQVSLRAGNSHQPIVDAPKSDDGLESKTLKKIGNAGNKNGISHRYPTSDQPGSRDVNAPNLDGMKSFNQTACNTLKEAKDLRDYADRVKSSGFGFESNEAYFQSALKYLHGAFILETLNNASGKHGDMTQMQFYGITAELCEICALEYERRREMAAAALAYKCIEVAYMRVVYYKHSSINGDRHEMNSWLRTVLQGESPSSSASDVDNLSNQAAMDKSTFDKVGGSLVAGSHISNAGSCTSFARLLDFTRNISLAMEASRKSQNAFVAASFCISEAKNMDYVASVKKVIDFSFQDVEELIRLVQLAMKTITHSGFGSARD